MAAIKNYSDITTPTPDGLVLAGFPVKTMAVELAAGTAGTTLKRGTVLAKGDDGCAAIATATTGKPYAILADDTALSTDKVVADAYETGHFNKKKLSVADGYTLTADDVQELRKLGIVLSDSIDGQQKGEN